MKALRIVLTQNKAHYRKEETITNKMTYPLPPFSTVIGALHNVCGFNKYHEMDLSIQGSYDALFKEAYTDYCFQKLENDRGILIKLKSDNKYSNAYDKVASAMKKTGNDFRKGITIQVHNQKLIKEYRSLKNLNDQIGDFKKTRLKSLSDLFKKRKQTLKDKKKQIDKKSEEFKLLSSREDEIKEKEKFITDKVKEFEYENYTKEISKYQSLTTSLKFYEVLHNVKLIIHIKSDEVTLNEIKDNIYNLKSIGRSEDFVDVKECEFVELFTPEDDISSQYSAYLNYDLIKNKDVLFAKRQEGIPANGTKYFINKVYKKDNGFREFEKVKVIYTSNYMADEDSENIYIDGKFIVNFN